MASKYKIIRNSAICLKCNVEIESKHVHDYVVCECGNIAVDGGNHYLKRSATDMNLIKDTSISEEV